MTALGKTHARASCLCFCHAGRDLRFCKSMAAVATGVIFAMGIFKFVGGRWISAIAWGVASVILFAIVAGVKSFIVGMI